MIFTIKRVSTDKDGTFGVLLFNNTPFAVTLERQWLNNKPSISCIPAGNYICKRVNSPKFGDTFEITGVPGRTHILFHKGNVDNDSHGCVLIGEKFGILGADSAILDSKGGFNEFMAILKEVDDFNLTIENKWS